MFYDTSISKFEENGHTISLASIAVPKFFEMVFVQMLGTVNTIMLSGYSQVAVAAASVAEQIQNFIVIILNIIISGMTIVMSVELGKKDANRAGRVAGTSVLLMLGSALILGNFIAVFAEQSVSFMNLEGVTKNLSSQFLRIKSTFLFVTMTMSCFNNLLICNGYAGSSFGIGILTNVLNVVFNYIVLYSGIDLPIGGVTGIAVTSVIAQVIALSVAVFIFIKKKCPFIFTFDINALKRVLRIGTPSGLGMVSYMATQLLTTGFVASLGMVMLNTKVYIVNIINYISNFSFSIATANGVLMGRYRGQEEFGKIKALYRQNMAITVASNLILSVLVFIFHKPLISLFTTDSEILALSAHVMAVDIIVEIARAVNHISEKSLNANGDIKTTFVAPLFTCWIFGVLLAYVLGIKCGLGLVGFWIGFAADEVVKASIYVIRWKSDKWKNSEI